MLWSHRPENESWRLPRMWRLDVLTSAPVGVTTGPGLKRERVFWEDARLAATKPDRRLHRRVRLLLAARFDLGRDATVLDLSAGGARLEHQSGLRPGAACRLRFALDDEVFLFDCGVVWSRAVQSRSSGGEMLFHSGLAFERVPNGAKRLLALLAA